ncbi:uncharacterized protein LOC115884840 [Sitophilus oryzae]|uniref:Uncharacterized protein LOC115884840 n=1 Tax=Sitophilus oryzae TaxID=7048 RepID=A0A6J2Y6D8_SITOR|nr:uncharacterized protein LOC115884840 [Sitophilus oryzae]
MTDIEETSEPILYDPLIKQSSPATPMWNHVLTLGLLDLYKKYRDQVGSFQIKSMKKMWEKIAVEINTQFDVNFTECHCENRWRVVERNYKKYLNGKFGRRYRYFEYKKEMEEIVRKRNINMNSSPKKTPNPTTTPEIKQVRLLTIPFMPTPSKMPDLKPVNNKNKVVKKNPDTNHVLEQMRRDKKEFYINVLKLRREKLNLLKEKLNFYKETRREELLLQKQHNELLKEKNQLLKGSEREKIHVTKTELV